MSSFNFKNRKKQRNGCGTARMTQHKNPFLPLLISYFTILPLTMAIMLFNESKSQVPKVTHLFSD